MTGRLSVVMAAFFLMAFAGKAFAESRDVTYWEKGEASRVGSAAAETWSETNSREKDMVFKKDGNRVSIPGTVSVRLEGWEAVYIPVDVETNWFKSTRTTLKPVLVQLTATPSTYLPFSDNEEFIELMEDVDARRDFIYGMEKASGREVEAVHKVNHDGRDYIGTRYKSDSDKKVLFSLGSIAKNGLMVAFTFCFDRADDNAVTDFDGTSIITSFLENVSFGSAPDFQF